MRRCWCWASIVPIRRSRLSLIDTRHRRVKSLLGRRCSCALTSAKGSAVGVVWRIGICAAMGIVALLSSVLTPWLLHLLPCRKDICPGFCISGSWIWLLRGWRRAEVLVCKPVCARGVRVLVLGWWGTLCLRSRGRGAIVGPIRGSRRVRVALGGRWSCSRRVGRVCGGRGIPVLPPLCVILCSLGGIT